MQFGKNLARLRRDRGMSQRTAAKALGISQALLSHYENGLREPGIDFLIRAAAYFGCTVDVLLGLAAPGQDPARSEWQRTVTYLTPLLGDELERYLSLSLCRLLLGNQPAAWPAAAEFALTMCRGELEQLLRSGSVRPGELMPETCACIAQAAQLSLPGLHTPGEKGGPSWQN